MNASRALRVARLELVSHEPATLATFYRRALSFVDDPTGAPFALRLGGTRLSIVAAPADATPVPDDLPGWSPLFQHFAIRVSDVGAALAQLRSTDGWRAISTAGPERLPVAAGGVTAFKFRDPDGHPLELIAFSDEPPGPLHVGIDHTALSVADVATSIAFYERLGFTVGARSLNRGIEQSRMDGIADALVDVVTLEPPSKTSPHLELLGYRGAFDRASVPRSRADDLVATRIVLAGGDEGNREAMRDPDGHWLAHAVD